MTVALKDMNAKFLLTKVIEAFKKRNYKHPGQFGNLYTSTSLIYNGYKITAFYGRDSYTHKIIISVYDRKQTKKAQEYAKEVNYCWVPIWSVPEEIRKMRPAKQLILTQEPTFDTQFSNINDWEVVE